MNSPSSSEYDNEILELWNVLLPFSIRGWHCTRLTDSEVSAIERFGMQLPNGAMIDRRLNTLVSERRLELAAAERLKQDNQAEAFGRGGVIWFCFFTPRLAGVRGIERFFRHWGGEGLYVGHENDPVLSPILGRIGTPSIVEADVPIAKLSMNGGLWEKIIRRFLISCGFRTSEPVRHEDHAVQALPAETIRRIHRFPGARFCSLTGCLDWDPPLEGG